MCVNIDKWAWLHGPLPLVQSDQWFLYSLACRPEHLLVIATRCCQERHRLLLVDAKLVDDQRNRPTTFVRAVTEYRVITRPFRLVALLGSHEKFAVTSGTCGVRNTLCLSTYVK